MKDSREKYGVNHLALAGAMEEISIGAKTLNDEGSSGSKWRGGNVATVRGLLIVELDEAYLEESAGSVATSQSSWVSDEGVWPRS